MSCTRARVVAVTVHTEFFAAALSKRAIMEAWEGGKGGDLVSWRQTSPRAMGPSGKGTWHFEKIPCQHGAPFPDDPCGCGFVFRDMDSCQDVPQYKVMKYLVFRIILSSLLSEL